MVNAVGNAQTNQVDNNPDSDVDGKETSGGYIPNDSEEDFISNLGTAEGNLDKSFDGIKADQYWEKDDDGYYSLKSEPMDMLNKMLKSILGLRTVAAMIADTWYNLSEILRNAMAEQKESARSSGKRVNLSETTAKTNAKLNSDVESFFLQTFNDINQKNQALYKERMDAEEEEANEWHDKYIPFCDDEESYLENCIEHTEEFNAATDKSMAALRIVASEKIKGTLTREYEYLANRAVANISSDGLFATGDNGYIDENAMKEVIMRSRNMFITALNVQKIILMADIARSEALNTVYEGSSGNKGAGKSNLRSVEQELEGEINRKTAMFDKLAETTLVSIKLRNQKNYLDLQLEKAQGFWHRTLKIVASLAQIACLVLAVIGLCLSEFGIGLVIAIVACALLSALAKWGAGKTADVSVDDEYCPTLEKEKDKYKLPVKDRSAAGQLNDVSNHGSSEIDGVDDGYMSTDSTGNKNVDTGLLAERYAALNRMNNVIRTILHVDTTKATLANMVFSNMSGISSYKGSNAVSSTVEANMHQANMEFQERVSDLQTYANAKNMEVAQDNAMEEATQQLWISIALAVISALITFGCGASAAGVGLAFTVGMTVGQALGTFMSNAGKLDNEFTTGRDIGKDTKSKTRAKIAALEYEIYENMLSNGTVKSGKSKKAANHALLGKLQKAMTQLMAVRSLIATISQIKQQMVNAVASTTSGIATAGSDNFLAKIIKSDIEASMVNMEYINQLNEQSAAAHNRAVDAKNAMIEAGVRAGIAVAVAVVCGSIGGNIALGLGSGIIGIATSLASAVFRAIDWSDKNKINLPNEEENKTSEDPEKNSNKKVSTEKKLRNMQIAADNAKVDDGAISHYDGGLVGVNMGYVSELQAKVVKTWRVAEIISEIQQAVVEMKATEAEAGSGVQVIDSSSILAEAVNLGKQMAITSLNAQAKVAQDYVAVENEKAAAQKAFWGAIVSAGIQAVLLAVQCTEMSAQSDVQEVQDQMQDREAAELTDEQTEKIQQNDQTQKDMFWWNVIFGLANIFSEYLTGVIFDAATGGENDKGEVKESVKENQEAKEKKLEESKGYEQTMLALEAEDTAYSGTISAYEQHTEQISMQTTNDALGQGIADTPTAVVDMARQYKDLQKNMQTLLQQFSRARSEAFKKLSKLKEEMAVMNAAKKEYERASTEFQKLAEDNQTPNSQLLNAYADMIEAAATVQTAEQAVASQLAVVDEAAKKLREEREAILGDENKTEKLDDSSDEAIKTEKEKLEQTGTEIDKKIEELKELKEQIASATPEEAENIKNQAAEESRELNKLIGKFDEQVTQSTVLSEMAEALTTSVSADNAQAEFDKLIDKKTNGKPLEEMSAKELSDLYAQLHEEFFKPAAKELQELILKRRELQKELKDNDLTAERKAELESELNNAMQEEGKIRQKLQSFNRLIGKMDKIYYIKTKAETGVGKHLELDEMSIPSGNSPKTTAAGAVQAAVNKRMKGEILTEAEVTELETPFLELEKNATEKEAALLEQAKGALSEEGLPNKASFDEVMALLSVLEGKAKAIKDKADEEIAPDTLIDESKKKVSKGYHQTSVLA